MKSNLICAALACLALALSATAAMAASNPIPGVDIIVRKNPGGTLVMHTQTSPTGQVQFKNLLPGDYVIEIDGPSLVASMDSLAPLPKKKSGGSSFSLGFGGFSSGGGSSHSHSSQGGAGPVGGAPGGSVHDNTHSSSGGGVAAGVAVGDVNGDGLLDDSVVQSGNQTGMVTFTITVTGPPADTVSSRQPNAGGNAFSSTTPYCRETAGQGMRFAFKIPENESPTPQDVTFTATVIYGGQPVQF